MSQRLGRKSARILTRNKMARSFIVRQETGGHRDATNGEWLTGTWVNTTLKGLIHPITDRQRMELEEGERLNEAISVIVATLNMNLIRPLKVGSTQAQSDVIIVDNINYWVRIVSDWSDFGHINVIATRQDQQ
jgi:hypothetical protein